MSLGNAFAVRLRGLEVGVSRARVILGLSAIIVSTVLAFMPGQARASEDNYVTHGPMLGRVGATEPPWAEGGSTVLRPP